MLAPFHETAAAMAEAELGESVTACPLGCPHLTVAAQGLGTHRSKGFAGLSLQQGEEDSTAWEGLAQGLQYFEAENQAAASDKRCDLCAQQKEMGTGSHLFLLFSVIWQQCH